MSTDDDIDLTSILEYCKVRCPRCEKIWTTSLGVEFCNCLVCGQKLYPLKHVVADSENEVN